MEDHQGQDPNGSERSEPVRSRWTPKPEQIIILESIFNGGMINPPKDETVRIRKLIEKFGPVGDANVFYWFQNRRSRSRRRQRQLQANFAAGEQINHGQACMGAIEYGNNSTCAAATMGYTTSPAFASTNFLGGSSSSSSCGVMGDDVVKNLYSMSGQMGFQEIEQSSSETSYLHYQPGFITVFINGVPTEMPRGPLDMKAVFGQDAILVHSSGVPVPTNEFGFSIQSLQHGESYFLVSRTA